MANDAIHQFLTSSGWAIDQSYGGEMQYHMVDFEVVVGASGWWLNHTPEDSCILVTEGDTLTELQLALDVHPGYIAAIRSAAAFKLRQASGQHRAACSQCGQSPCETPEACAADAKMEAS